ncbi:hypothetical protein L218DRAFT_731101 [Marasmius fiardii PR-910]|nr:hypothetical protein L218DRAFT_731101 [Marasmius fiardii PR-910]
MLQLERRRKSSVVLATSKDSGSSTSGTSLCKERNPFRDRLNKDDQTQNSVKIRRRVHIAEIIQFRDCKFTVVTLEPEDGMAIKRMDPLKEQVIEVSSQRREYLLQLFGVGRSSLPTFIYHDALLIRDTVFDQFICMPVMWSYIWYRCVCSSH